MPLFQSFYADAFFRLSNLSWLDLLDLLLVTTAFYLLLKVVQHTRAAFLLRGVLVLGVFLFIITILLPLPTFDWLVQGLLVAMLIATPIIFQPELRRLLERVGRGAGATLAVRQTAAENALASILRAVERLSANHTGALIAIEGHHSLQEIEETGVPVGGQVTSELLEAIFYPENPLHDGAVIVREDRVVAAACVLPLTERPLPARHRLGTRHRAAVGLSEINDALVIVVSEETGQISVARNGHLQRPLDSAGLREQLFGFFIPAKPGTPSPSTWGLFREIRQLWQRPARPDARQMLSNTGLWFVSLLLALVAWALVVEQTNPARLERVDNIPLRLLKLPAGVTPVDPLPSSVSAIIQTTSEVQRTLGPGSFQAQVSLAGLASGPHQVPITVVAGVEQVRVLNVIPATLDIELAPVITRTLPVVADLQEQAPLSPAYQLMGTPVVSPSQVQVSGAAPLVEAVSRLQVPVSLANRDGPMQVVNPVQAVDDSGQEISGVKLKPSQVQVSAAIRRRVNALDVGVRAVIKGAPAPGYWLSGISVTPNSVTLQSSPDRLAETGSFIDTLPVDITNAAGNLSMEVPLNLPPEMQAFDSQGRIARAVTVQVQIDARSGDLVVSRPVELLNAQPGITATVSPARVDLLLSGPLPILNDIEADPALVRVLVDTATLAPGESLELAPTVITPPEIQAQVVPPSVVVRAP